MYMSDWEASPANLLKDFSAIFKYHYYVQWLYFNYCTVVCMKQCRKIVLKELFVKAYLTSHIHHMTLEKLPIMNLSSDEQIK